MQVSATDCHHNRYLAIVRLSYAAAIRIAFIGSKIPVAVVVDELAFVGRVVQIAVGGSREDLTEVGCAVWLTILIANVDHAIVVTIRFALVRDVVGVAVRSSCQNLTKIGKSVRLAIGVAGVDDAISVTIRLALIGYRVLIAVECPS